jgi:uncharacterized coiled-coil protein SlyX
MDQETQDMFRSMLNMIEGLKGLCEMQKKIIDLRGEQLDVLTKRVEAVEHLNDSMHPGWN